MSAGTFECRDCEQHYCIACDGGEDSCPKCSTGPRCDDCAYDHEQEHNREAKREEA